MKLNLYRPLSDGSSIKSCTFTKAGRHWWITMAIDVPVSTEHAWPDSAIGLDVGIEHLVTTSEGFHTDNIRPRSKRERELRIAQRALARCKRGSKRRKKVWAKLAKIQRSIANVRSNHLHQVSADLAKRYSFIAVEKLKTKNMTRSAKGTAAEPGTNVRQKAGLNKAVLDASPARRIQLLTYKAERAGGVVAKVDPRGTSQDCSSCGAKVAKALSERRNVCCCGADLHRDHNAARNILQRALVAHGRAMPPGGHQVGHRPERRPRNAFSCNA